MDQAGQIYSSDVAFTPSVKAVQERKGSRAAYARVEQGGSWATHVTAELAAFIAEQTSLFLATASAAGQPYVQHRGGPPGFLRVVDDTTLGFVDFTGNKQFITLGNLAENDQAQLFLIDYATRRRIKIWGRAEVVEGDEKLTAALMPSDYRARPSQVILFKVSGWDANCPQHIPLKIDAADVNTALAERDERIRVLEAEVAALRAATTAR
jgi:predicted pyridoxine 5'-phosphate oxidase superfamily flavin-nucleotide-binding protein